METFKNGYVAVVLDIESSQRLLALAIHPNHYAHHSTLFYHPEEETYEEHFGEYLGKRVTMQVTGIYQNSFGQCVSILEIDDVPRNRSPHITISCAEDIKPAYSNTLMQEAEPTEFHMILKGTIQFVEHKPKTD